jgi:HEAT repeat protein
LRDARATAVLLRIAQTPYNQRTAAATEYRDFFLKTAAGCALARLDADAARSALKTLVESTGEGDRSAAAIGLAAFGAERDIPTLVSLVGRHDGDGLAADFVVGYAGRFGAKAIPIYVAGLRRDDTAKTAVFRLAAIGKRAIPALRSLQNDPMQPPIVRRRATLAQEWMNEDRVRDHEPTHTK